MAEAARADDLLNADGLLWRIDKPGLEPSYLFGTIHSTDDSALEIARRAAELIKDAKIVATELGGPIDVIEKANITASMLAKALDRDHDTFEGVIPSEDRKSVEIFVTTHGYPVEFAHHLKPWFLAVLAALPACEAKREALDLPEVDQLLAQTAKDFGSDCRRARNAAGAARRHRDDAPGSRCDAAHSHRPRAGHERRPLCNDASTVPGEQARGDPAHFRRRGRIERGRAFGAG